MDKYKLSFTLPIVNTGAFDLSFMSSKKFSLIDDPTNLYP